MYDRMSKILYFTNGGVAQLGEHLPCKQGVKSSNLSVSIRVYVQRKAVQALIAAP